MAKRTARSGALIAMAAVIGLSACTAQYRTHGYVPSEEDLQQIVPGVDTRATVEEVVGSPSTGGVLNNGDFYYVQTEMRNYGWRAPEITSREVLEISFDQAGVVDNITRYGLQDGQVVPLTRRVTESGDGDIGFIRKLFGNIGGLDLGSMLNSQ